MATKLAALLLLAAIAIECIQALRDSVPYPLPEDALFVLLLAASIAAILYIIHGA